MENVERESFDIPGIGEIRARKGTSTAELAGAAAFWHNKYKSAWKDGFVTALLAIGTIGIAAGTVIHLWF